MCRITLNIFYYHAIRHRALSVAMYKKSSKHTLPTNEIFYSFAERNLLLLMKTWLIIFFPEMNLFLDFLMFFSVNPMKIELVDSKILAKKYKTQYVYQRDTIQLQILNRNPLKYNFFFRLCDILLLHVIYSGTNYSVY